MKIEVTSTVENQESVDQESLFKERTGEKFSYFYEKFNPRLVYYLNNITKDEHLAEDVATEAFMKAFEKIDQYEKGKAQFSTWLFTIARHIALQELKQSRKTMSIDTELDEEGTTLKDFIQEEESNDEFLFTLNNKKAEILKKYIAKLKQPYRKVIEMREIHNMQYRNISIEMGSDVVIKLNNTDKLSMELSSIYSCKDENGNSIEFTLEKSSEKIIFFDILKTDFTGKLIISGRNPKNLSTIKSQIKNARALLTKAAEKEFKLLEENYM